MENSVVSVDEDVEVSGAGSGCGEEIASGTGDGSGRCDGIAGRSESESDVSVVFRKRMWSRCLLTVLPSDKVISKERGPVVPVMIPGNQVGDDPGGRFLTKTASLTAKVRALLWAS